jgi:amino-acid N-acetyltransferase
VLQLLESVSLPTSDLVAADMNDFLHAGSADMPIGIVGVQRFGADALLRSLVVNQEHRSRGLGCALVSRAEQHARECGVTTIYLLTTTAEAFFLARGYRVTSRENAPAAIRATPEFAGICPTSSAFLSKRL